MVFRDNLREIQLTCNDVTQPLLGLSKILDFKKLTWSLRFQDRALDTISSQVLLNQY